MANEKFKHLKESKFLCKRREALIINILCMCTFFTFAPMIQLNCRELLFNPVDLLTWIFIIAGIRYCYACCFQLWHWYNGK